MVYFFRRNLNYVAYVWFLLLIVKGCHTHDYYRFCDSPVFFHFGAVSILRSSIYFTKKMIFLDHGLQTDEINNTNFIKIFSEKCVPPHIASVVVQRKKAAKWRPFSIVYLV